VSPQTFPQDKKWLALALLAAAQFVVVLDAAIVNVALPSIGTDLDFSQGDLSWVVNAYTLFFGGFLLLGGRMADLIGRRRMFTYGLILFAIASLAGGLASSPGMLIAARAVQGLGAALLSPAALSLVTVMFTEGSERNKAMGVWGAVAGSGGAAGVLLGGILTEYAGWEWVLWVNVPICIAAAVLAPRLLPESRNEGTRNFDVAGAVSVTAGLSLFVYAMVDANDAGWLSGQTLGLVAVSLALIAAFAAIELRSKAPLVPFSIFRRRTIVGVNVVGLLVAMSLFSMFFFISLYMQQVLGYSAIKSGLSYLPLAGGIIVSAGIASGLVTRFGFKPILTTGLVLTAIALVWFAQVDVGGSYLGDILFPSLIAAVGLGFAFVPMTIAAVAGVEPHETGLASGLINTSQQVGGALGLAILAAIANSRTDSLMADAGGAATALPNALTQGFQTAFMVGAGFAVLGAILSATLISSRTSREHAEAAQRGDAAPAPVAAEQPRPPAPPGLEGRAQRATNSRAFRSARPPAKPCGRPPWASRNASSRAAPASPRPSWSILHVSSA
jgi:EmrB/QacA subfamily drug resistance transporter